MPEPPFGHESAALPVQRLLAIGAILAAGVVATVVVVFVALKLGASPALGRAPPQAAVLPPEPRLQAHPAADLAAFRAGQQRELEQAGPADSTGQFTRIPIERAMALYARQHGSSASPPAAAPPPPPDLPTRVGFDQRLGAAVPLAPVWRDAQGGRVALGTALGNRPTLLVPGYYRCRNLCDVVRAGVAQAVAASGLKPGGEFNLVLFSIDPQETAADAAAAQRRDAAAYPRGAVAHWLYLTGTAAAVSELTRAIGFRSLFDPRNGQYAHPAGIVLLSPRGLITQYLLGVRFSPLTLRLALVDASHGRIGTFVDRLLLICCDYDPATGRYSLLITRVLQGLGLLTAATLAALLGVLRRAERTRRAGAPS